MRCGTLNTYPSKECECVVGFPLIHFNVFIKETFRDIDFVEIRPFSAATDNTLVNLERVLDPV